MQGSGAFFIMIMRLCAALVLGLFLANPAFAQAQPKAAPAAKAPPAGKAAPAAKAAPEASPTGAQTFLLGTFGEWKALVSGKEKSKICYALAQPKERKPATLKRDPAYIFISNRASDGAKGEIAFKLGFAAKAGQDGVLTLGTTSYALLANADNAFLKNPAQEAPLLEAMKKGSDFTLKASSQRGNETIDTYSLNGFAKALERMMKECP